MTVTAEASPRLVEINPERGFFRVHRSAYLSPEVYEREVALIFRKCWLYVGHQSELPNNGDFVSRRVGGYDLVFARSRKGELGAYFNNCTHRGARVCRERSGNARNFVCPYHGWVYGTDGKLLSMATDHGYAADANADGRLNLRAVPRLEEYRGFYFVNYNPRAISLYDYLADGRSVFDNLCDQAETGQVILKGEHSYTIRANYKLLVENSYDGYHLTSVHASYLDFLRDRVAGNPAGLAQLDETVRGFQTSGRARGLGMGHAILDSLVPTGRPIAQWVPPFGPEVRPEIEAKRAWLENKFGKERADYMADYQKNAVIFPNLVINDILAVTVRYIEPAGPDFMSVTAWAMGPTDESAALRKIRLDNFISFLGPAGFGSPDDIEMLEMCQRGNAHSMVEWSEISKGAQDNMDMLHAVGLPDDERHMQAYWTMWDRVIGGEETLEQT